jgi:hypothetical protein
MLEACPEHPTLFSLGDEQRSSSTVAFGTAIADVPLLRFRKQERNFGFERLRTIASEMLRKRNDFAP